MKQRVGLARALAIQPEILCMDEPFSALDVFTSETLRNEVIDLFTRPDTPVNSIVMVTHSISEGLFMATRLVVMGAHPGTIRLVLDNPLPYPRDEHHPDFVALDQQLHALITQSAFPTPTPGTSEKGGMPIQPIPIVSLSKAIGLLEVLENEGSLELFELARHVRLDLAQLLLVVKAAELLHWVTTPGGNVEMTKDGREFLAADITSRKQRIQRTLRGLYVFDLVLKLLRKSPRRELTEAKALAAFAHDFPREPLPRLLHAVVSWARYAELFKFSGTRRVFYGAKEVGGDGVYTPSSGT